MKVERYHYPNSVEEACRLLKDSPSAALIAGGTSLGFSGFGERLDLIDITGLSLNSIYEDDKGLHMGACVTLQQLAGSGSVSRLYCGMLRKAALSSGSRHVRNRATLGGGIAAGYHWSDLNVALMALGSSVAIEPGPREIRVSELLSAHPSKALESGDMIVSISLPPSREDVVYRFEKFARTEGDISLATIATSWNLVNGRVKEIVMVLGGATPRPLRLAALESSLSGKELGPETISSAIEAQMGELELISDMRASRWYQEQLVSELLHRVLSDGGGA